MNEFSQIIEKLSNNVAMTEEEAKYFFQKLEAYAREDFFFSFEPRGIQKKVLEAFRRHPEGYCEVILSGPNQIGKSFGSLWLIRDALTRRNEFRQWKKDPMLIFYICPKQEFQVQTIQAVLRKYLGRFLKDNLKGPPALKNGGNGAWSYLEFKNGDTIYFESFEADKKFIEGFAADLIIMDEGQQKFDYFETITQRAVSKQSPIFWTMIPDSTALPVYQKVFLPFKNGKQMPLREVIMANRDDYVAIHGEKVTSHLEATLSEEVVKKKIYGEWGAGEGLVYPVREEKHVITPFEIPSHWCRYVVCDWADSDNKHVVGEGVRKELKKSATTATFLATPPVGETVYLGQGRSAQSKPQEPVFFIYNEYHSTEKKLGKEHALEICKLFKPQELFEICGIDMSVDSSVFEEFRAMFYKFGQGYRFQKLTNKTKYSNTLAKSLQGIELVKRIISDDRLFIMANCKHTILEVLNYQIVEKTQLPQTWGDHHWDPIRYLLNLYPTYKNPLLLSDSTKEPNEEEDEYVDPIDEYLSLRNRVSTSQGFINWQRNRI